MSVALVATARGQSQDAFCEPGCEHDMQLFAPVDFDFDCQPIERGCGFFFNYSKLSWSVDNERTTIGSPGAISLSEDIFPEELALDPTVGPPSQYLIQNGLQNVTPSEWGWGDRYEGGYFYGQHSFMIGVLADVSVSSNETFGNGPQATGFGSIHVNFELATPDLLLGFRDYGGVLVNSQGGDVEVPTTTQGGPGVGGNGVVDDLNANLAAGPVTILGDINGDGTIDDDEIIGIAVDYGDLYAFNTTFNFINVRNVTRLDGIELMKNFVLDNDYMFVKDQNTEIEIGAGVRFLRIRDEFSVRGRSDFLRDNGVNFGNVVDTNVDNQMVGPQLYLRYTKQMRRLRFGAAGRFMFGYNIQDLAQTGVIGEFVTPGALNQSIALQPTAFNYGRQDNDFSPVGELRVDMAYKFTDSIAAKLGYTAVVADNITRSASVTRWRLPDMGFNESGQQTFFANGIDFGVEVTY